MWLHDLKFTYSEKATNFFQNLHRRFVLGSNGQRYGGDFAKLCGLLRIYEHKSQTFFRQIIESRQVVSKYKHQSCCQAYVAGKSQIN